MHRTSVVLTLLLWLLGGALMMASAQSGIRVLVVNEFANVRITPAIGAEVLGSVPGGYVFVDGSGVGTTNRKIILLLHHYPASRAGAFESPGAVQLSTLQCDIDRVS